jgi:autophagy-related protein 11
MRWSTSSRCSPPTPTSVNVGVFPKCPSVPTVSTVPMLILTTTDLMELDGAMRDDLVTLTNVKNEFTLDVHIHLRQVATFQTRITELIQPLRTLDTELRSKAAFPHLARLHQLPFAYAATVVEVVRRKEFASFVVDWTTRLADTLVKFTSVEKARRMAIRNDTLSQLPWTVAAIEDTMSPSIDVVVNVGVDALAKVNLGRSDIDSESLECGDGDRLTWIDLLAWVESLKGAESLAIDGSDPIAFLQTNLEAMISKIDLAGDELDRMIERSGGCRFAFVWLWLMLTRPVFMAQDGRVSDQALAAERDAALAQVREVEEQYERRTQTLQTRQAELQDEVYRLRNDLSEEVDARQALSAQLEERAKEQRDHDDLVAALQADMQQEKDRATDLGTRLQEALIDVDGLRHSEAGLREQIESLQEERSRHLEEITEAQTRSETFESQLARVRAELESTTEQLAKAHQESRHSSAEAERLRRDHLAEADGDRAVLDQQIFTLTKQLDEANGKMTSARNTAIREANGLKAELSLTQVQLRDARRKEAALADELAMARDAAAASSQKEQDADVARDAVVLAGRYHDLCASLLKTINTSSTISGASRSKSPVSGSQHESILARSLASASAFDLDEFKEAVARAINAARKFGKTAKYWREQARHRISFTSFEDGDLVSPPGGDVN